MNDFFSGRDCFLADPAWAEVTREPWDPAIDPEIHELLEEMINTLYLFPALVRDALDFRTAATAGAPDIVAAADILNRGSTIYHRLQTWHERFSALSGPPEAIPSPSEDPMYPVCYRYSSFAVGTTYCAYFACMVMLQEMLADAQYPLTFQIPTATYIDDICRSVEWNGQGTWGPYRMGFSMRIAAELGSAEVKAWLRGWLMRFSKVYPVASPSNWPALKDEAVSSPLLRLHALRAAEACEPSLTRLCL